MKTTFKLLFTAVTLSMFLLTNCRTGDDGTNNHGKATEGIDDRVREKLNRNKTDDNDYDTHRLRDELADTIDRLPKM